jgi:Ca2+:H+ antiporter
VVGIVQSAFGNAAELAITVLALRANLPEVVKIAIVGSLLGNAVLLGGLAGLLPLLRNGFSGTLKFDRRLFSGIATLSVIAFVPMAILSVPSDLLTGDRRGVSLAAGIALTVVGVFFVLIEIRTPAAPGAHGHESKCDLSFRTGLVYLGAGGAMAAVTAEWFVAGFEPATKAIGIPTAFAALVIIPLLGNVAENYVALRYAWAGDGDGAMSVIMHSVVQIALLMTGILVIASQFIGRNALSLQLDPVLTVSLGLALVVLWMIMYDGEMQPVEAVGLLAVYVILGATIWAEGSLGT